MLQIFILLLLATITYGIYYVICIIIDKKSRRNFQKRNFRNGKKIIKKVANGEQMQ